MSYIKVQSYVEIGYGLRLNGTLVGYRDEVQMFTSTPHVDCPRQVKTCDSEVGFSCIAVIGIFEVYMMLSFAL